MGVEVDMGRGNGGEVCVGGREAKGGSVSPWTLIWRERVGVNMYMGLGMQGSSWDMEMRVRE